MTEDLHCDTDKLQYHASQHQHFGI